MLTVSELVTPGASATAPNHSRRSDNGIVRTIALPMLTAWIAVCDSSSGVSARTSIVSVTAPTVITKSTSRCRPERTTTGVRMNREKPASSATIV